MKLNLEEIMQKRDYYLSKEFIMKNKVKIFSVFLAFILLFGGIMFLKHKKKKEIVENLDKVTKEERVDKENEFLLGDSEFIVIDISGAVNSPNLLELPAKSRLEDAIKGAGGLTEDADLKKINRAEALKDGQKIYIPHKNEENYQDKQGNIKGDIDKKININEATSDELRTINGIGPAMAERIIVYRAEKGKFSSVEDLKNVDGIGEKTFDKIKGKLTV